MKQCYELLRNVLLDAFNVPTIYFTPPYDDISKIDQGIRAAVCWNEELAVLSRGHNDANLLSIPARFVSFEMALKMASAFLEE